MSTRFDLEMDVLLQSQDLTDILYSFNNPNGPTYNVFIDNLDSLKVGSTPVIYNMSKWDFNPEQFSLDYYKDQNLAHIVMLVNGIRSRFEFLPKNFKNERILAPIIDDIYKLLSFK